LVLALKLPTDLVRFQMSGSSSGVNAVDSDALVAAILINIKCEVRDAVAHFYKTAGTGPTYLDHWGVDTLLNLQVSEKSTLAPTADLLPASPANAVFSVGLGVNGSAEATRTNSVESFSTVGAARTAFQHSTK
jgi:hypothetical protein